MYNRASSNARKNYQELVLPVYAYEHLFTLLLLLLIMLFMNIVHCSLFYWKKNKPRIITKI